MAKANSKAAKKIAEKKAKIAAKCGRKAAKACAVIALLAAVAGCATSDPSSRSTSAKYGDIIVKVGDGASNNTVTVTLGDGAIASADSEGSTESTTATPTNTTDVKPQTDVNTTGGRTAGVLESVVGAFGAWLATPSGKEAAAKCDGASCSPCGGGSCVKGGGCASCEE